MLCDYSKMFVFLTQPPMECKNSEKKNKEFDVL